MKTFQVILLVCVVSEFPNLKFKSIIVACLGPVLKLIFVPSVIITENFSPYLTPHLFLSSLFLIFFDCKLYMAPNQTHHCQDCDAFLLDKNSGFSLEFW